MLLYLLLDNLKNDDSSVGFANIIVFSECIVNITLLCRKYSCHIIEATRFEVVNSFIHVLVCVQIPT